MLSKSQLKQLKSMGHELNSMVQIGKDGLKDQLLDSINTELEAHELVKITLLKTCELSAKDVMDILEKDLRATPVDLIGRTLVVYRRSKKNKLEL